MSYYQPCTMGTFLLCSIYMFILHVGQAVVSKPASSNYFIVGLCDEKKTPYSTFKLNLVQHWGEHSMSIELLQAAWLPSTTKSAWIRALESLREFSFLSFSPPRPLFFLSLSFFFKFLQLLVALSVHHCGFQEKSSICNREHTEAKD